MADMVQTGYMDKATVGYREIIVTEGASLQPGGAHSACNPGDRAIVLDEGKVYFCVEKDVWTPFGGNA